MLAAVMDDMRRPEPPDPVRRAVEPVISQIIEHEGQGTEPQHVRPADLDVKNSELVNPQAEREYQTAGQDAGNDAARTQCQRGERIPGLIADLFVLAAPPPFHGDGDDEERDRPVGRGWQIFHDRDYLHEC
jgi:hypothetical protein